MLVVEDERLLSELLAEKLMAFDDLEVVGLASSVAEAERMAAERSPHVVLMDYHLPDGTGAQAAAAIRRLLPACAVVMVSSDTDEESIRRAVEAGAVGYIPKSKVVAEVVDGVRRAAEGEILLSPRVLADMLRQRASTIAAPAAVQAELLTSRELDVLRLMGDGLDSRVIAERLFLSYNTVRGYAQKVIEKLEARSRLEAVVRAKERGLI